MPEPESVLSHSTVVDNIAEVLRGAGGDWVAQIYNQVCSDKVEYIGDSMFRTVPRDGGAT